MAHFQAQGRLQIKKDGVTIEEVTQLLKKYLSNYYDESEISIQPFSVMVKGNLKSFWERAITKAEAQIAITDNMLAYKVEGSTSLGGWPWLWFILGFFTGVMFFWFLFDLVEYIISRDRPKKYFEEAFKAIEFEIG